MAQCTPFHNVSREPAGSGPLTLSSSNGATIYFTTNGLDPRVAFTGAIAPHALPYSSPVTLPAATTLNVRACKEGAWSALVVARSSGNR